VRVRLPIVLLLAALITQLSVGQQSRPADERVFYTNKRQFFLPSSADPKRPISELRLYVREDAGTWQYLTSMQPNQKGFNFTTSKDGQYQMAVQAVFQDGSTEPSREQLRAEYKVVIDSIPPRINVRPFSTPEGSAGVEWDIIDDAVDQSTVRLEYRWPGMVDWAPIDKGVAFKSRDSRTWVLKPDQRIEIRVKASDMAKNDATSQAVTTSSTAGDSRQFVGESNTGTGNNNGNNTNAAVGERGPATQHFVNSTIVKLNYNVTVGPSGLKKVTLWKLDDKNTWSKALEKDGTELKPDRDAPAVLPGERPRTEPLTLTHDVVKDGTYGFAIVVESRAGVSGRDPRPGDPPLTTVVVDTTPPLVKMNEPKVRPNGAVAQGALVDITWTATDKNMAVAPITLECAEKLDGTWRVIAEKIDNTGKHTWAVPPTEPYSFYVRVKAVDRAGNVAGDISKQNVIVDLTVPQVEIRDVAPGGR